MAAESAWVLPFLVHPSSPLCSQPYLVSIINPIHPSRPCHRLTPGAHLAPALLCRRYAADITWEELVSCFHLPTDQACKELGVGKDPPGESWS